MQGQDLGNFVSTSCFRGVLTKLSCPACLVPVNTQKWLQIIASIDKKNKRLCEDAIETYRDFVDASCQIRCPICDCTDSLIGYKSYAYFPPTLVLSKSVIKQIPKLKILGQKFCRHKVTPKAIIDYVEHAFGQGMIDTIIPNMLTLIEDTERRATLFHKWMQLNPFTKTLCCGAPVCFSCKVGHHHTDEPCAKEERVEDIVKCANCPLYLAKGDGCDSVACYCGEEFSWFYAVLDGKIQAMEPHQKKCLKNAFYRYLSKMRETKCRKHFRQNVIASIPDFVHKMHFKRLLHEKEHIYLSLRRLFMPRLYRLRMARIIREIPNVVLANRLKSIESILRENKKLCLSLYLLARLWIHRQKFIHVLRNISAIDFADVVMKCWKQH